MFYTLMNRTASCCIVLLLAGCLAQAEKPYQPSWESLKRHETPEWFRDAKFGIYTHWGPVTVGAEDGQGGVQWYGAKHVHTR